MAQTHRGMNHRHANGAKSSASRDRAPVEEAVRIILRHVGQDPEREGLKSTPTRVVKAFEFFTSGYLLDPKTAINGALFVEENYQEMILCRDVDFFSLCEHHLLPFMAKAHVAYLP